MHIRAKKASKEFEGREDIREKKSFIHISKVGTFTKRR